MVTLYKALLISLVVIVDLSHIHANDQYFQLNSPSGTYNYGYPLTPKGNFHHERRDQNDVTYGCYGYVDPKKRLHVTHYISDRMGYRVVEPNKPLIVFLTDRISLQAFLLPKGCGLLPANSPSNSGPELIYKPPGITNWTTKRPSTTTPISSTTKKPVTSPPCSCSQATTTEPSPVYTIGTSKPPSATVGHSTTPSTITPAPQTTTTPKPSDPLIDVDLNVNLLKPTQYMYRPNDHPNEHIRITRAISNENSTLPRIYYVPYQNHRAPPPGVQSTSPPGNCAYNYGYLGLAPVIFVPIGVAQPLGLVSPHLTGITLRKFAMNDAGNLTVTEVLDDKGQPIPLDYSNALRGIINSGDFDSLRRGC
ncbi:myb-like protein U [Armigeres subalbatus]|uniref:myb-like protein U n=1 Tax=Armigeres subalbatus TaxID=124917 RepID=UPI002ED0EB8E